jgi:hypothetical protein
MKTRQSKPSGNPVLNALVEFAPKTASGRPRITRSKAITALRKLTSERPDTAAMWNTMLEFFPPREESDDRACALVLGAILEQSLELAILSHCVSMDENEKAKLFGPPEEAPVTFDIKIRFGYALGIYGVDSRDDLVCIRHIRNVFAHTKAMITFNSEQIVDICDHLKFMHKIPWGGLVGPFPLLPRSKFLEAIRHYFIYLALPRDNGAPIRYREYYEGKLPDLYA